MALPKGPRTAVRDLERLEALRLSVALALVGGPRLLGIDDTDLKLSDGERAEVWALLKSLADAGTTVVAVCSEAPEGAVTVSTAQNPDEPPAEDEADRTDDTDRTDEADQADQADQGEEKADALAETGRA